MSAQAYWWGQRRPRSQRPRPRTQSPLPPFDPSIPGEGNVYTTLPPEFRPATSRYFLQGNFGGVVLTGHFRWNGPQATPGSSITMTDGPWQGLTFPFLVGASSTPPTLILTPMLPLYSRAVQDAVLTEHAWRAYPDFTVADVPWDADRNGVAWTPQQTVQWAQYVRSWGFRVPLWSVAPINGDPTFRAMLNAHCVDFFVPGEEIATNPDHRIPAEDLPPILDTALNDCGGGIPIAIHLTPYGPLRDPADTFLDGGPNRGSWAQYNGKVGLAWEGGNWSASPTEADSAAMYGALLGYARRMVQTGKSGDGDWGIAGPSCPIYVWELLAESMFDGHYQEPYGDLRTWEMLCCPADPGCRMIDGYNNGGRRPDGTPIYLK